MSDYLVPLKNAQHTLVEKNSKFIASIFKVDTESCAKEHISNTKKEHPNAVHNCFAYIIKDENIERFSDDGEPQGTAGKPILEVLKNEQITNVLCIVTRYFGGTLLGTGGLVRAYSHSAKNALICAGVAKMELFYDLTLTTTYNLYDTIIKQLESFTHILNDTIYTDEICISLSIIACDFDDFCLKIAEISSATVVVTKISERFLPKRIDKF